MEPTIMTQTFQERPKHIKQGSKPTFYFPGTYLNHIFNFIVHMHLYINDVMEYTINSM